MEYRAVELCEEIASAKVIELAIKYARRISRIALSNKFESIADTKEEGNEMEKVNQENGNEDIKNDNDMLDNDIKESTISLTLNKKPDVEIKPLSMSEALSMKRSNPFLKSGNSPTTKGITAIMCQLYSLIFSISNFIFITNKIGLAGLDTTPDKPQKVATPTTLLSKSKAKETKSGPKKETFIGWYSKNKKSLQQEFPELSLADLTKTALARYKEKDASSQSSLSEPTDSKKRKLSPESEHNQPKRATSTILNSFAFQK